MKSFFLVKVQLDTLRVKKTARPFAADSKIAYF